MTSLSLPLGSRARVRRWSVAPLLQSIPYLVPLALVFGVPLVLLLTYSFRPSTFAGVGSGFTLANYEAVFESGAYMTVIRHSITVGLTVAVVVSALAFVVAYAIRFRLRTRFAAVALGVVVLTSVASLLVRIYAWGTILGTHGLINRALESVGLIDQPLGFLFFGYFAIVVTMIYVYLPLSVLIVNSALQDVDPRALEASRDLGAGRWRTALLVVAPQARNGLFGAFALTTILASADYITPTLVGGVHGTMVGNLIYSLALQQGNSPAAAALAFVYLAFLLLTVVALGLLFKLLQIGGRRFVRGGIVNRFRGVGSPRLGRVSFSRTASALLLVYLLAPTIIVILFSFNSGQAVGLPWKGFTLDWYSRAVQTTGFGDALWTSIRLGVVATLAATAIGVCGGFALRNATGLWRRFMWVATFIPFAVPGVLLGTALLTIAIDQQIQLGLVATMFVHTVLCAPLTILVVAIRLESMDRRVIEAARDLGSRPVRALRTITVPLILPALLGAALFNFAYSLDELVVTSFTIGSYNTLPVWLFGQARRGFTPAINALGVMLLFGTIGAFAGASLVLRRSMQAGGRSAG